MENERLLLHVTEAWVSFVAGTRSLSVPISYLERSPLITERLRDGLTEGYLSSSLSIDDLSVWLTCSRSLKDGDGLQRRSDENIICAWKVAKVLQDHDMRKAAWPHVAAVMVGKVVKSTNLEPAEVHEMWAELRAVHKKLSCPAATPLLTILKQRQKIEPTFLPEHANMLLGLLPGQLHCTIIQAYCVSIPEGDTSRSMLSITMPAWDSSKLQHKDINSLANSSQNAKDYDPLTATTTTAFQLLAAAAPLTGGSLKKAWKLPNSVLTRSADKAGQTLTHDINNQASRTNPTDSAENCGDSATVSQSTGHNVTGGGDVDCAQWPASKDCEARLRRLLLRFDVLGVMQMPSRWCFALRQLVTLQHVHLELFARRVDPQFTFCISEFSAALASLTALKKLAIRFDVNQDRCLFEPDVVRVTSESTIPLLSELAKLPELTLLALDGCINVHVSTLVRSEDPSDRINKAFSCLLNLKQLTCLVMRFSVLFGGVGAQYGSQWAAALGGAVRQLPALAKLHLAMDVCSVVADIYSTPVAAADELVLELFSKPGLIALKDLGISLDRGYWMLGNGHDPAGLPATLFKRIADCIRHRSGASLVQLTSLTLKQFNFAEGSHAAAMVAPMIARWTALQSLTLSSMAIEDVGLRAISWVLPRLQGLTHLNISDTGATPTGVFAVLGALLGPERAGQHSLKSLNISRSCAMIHSEQRYELARLLGQFRVLERLEIEDLVLGFAGLQEITMALGGLPHLQSVKACGNTNRPRQPVMAYHALSAWLKEAIAKHLPGVPFVYSRAEAV